jgi:hypothetical protein
VFGGAKTSGGLWREAVSPASFSGRATSGSSCRTYAASLMPQWLRAAKHCNASLVGEYDHITAFDDVALKPWM